MSTDAAGSPGAASRVLAVLRRALGPVVFVIVVIAVVQLAAGLDWGRIAAALAGLQAWQLLVLLGCVAVRQWLNALPLTFYIDGVGPVRALQNQQAAIMFTTVAPPPSDLLLRLKMFRSWGVEATDGLAGTVLNTLTFYVVCFAAPLLGAVLFGVTGQPQPGRLALGLLLALVSAAIVVALKVGLRGERQAAALGQHAGQLVRRVRRSVDPQRWRDAVVQFRGTVAHRIGRQFPRGVVALIAMVAVEALMIVLAARFVGLGAEKVGALTIVAAFLLVYPLVLMPFSGLGLLDAAVAALVLTAVGSGAIESDLVAAFVVWRVATLLVPLVLGALSLLTWWIQQRR